MPHSVPPCNRLFIGFLTDDVRDLRHRPHVPIIVQKGWINGRQGRG